MLKTYLVFYSICKHIMQDFSSRLLFSTAIKTLVWLDDINTNMQMKMKMKIGCCRGREIDHNLLHVSNYAHVVCEWLPFWGFMNNAQPFSLHAFCFHSPHNFLHKLRSKRKSKSFSYNLFGWFLYMYNRLTLTRYEINFFSFLLSKYTF
jgi:hypothetical protein